MYATLDHIRSRRLTRRLTPVAACVALALFCADAAADRWTTISTTDVPTARTAHSAVFTRIDGTDQMIVWGGQDSGMTPFANTGGVWTRRPNQWTAMSTV